MKIKMLLTLIMLWCVYVLTVQGQTAPTPGETANTDCTAIRNGTGAPGGGTPGSGSGSGTHVAPR
ncbi:MAG: hypothetical protein A2X86_06010 [Bdellovibrionales bacterium GWA2_49_15]|nr:MAG: hypothetical protein A2X86_06010 [Bdellovibrionales bacterium GWA2_49_15]